MTPRAVASTAAAAACAAALLVAVLLASAPMEEASPEDPSAPIPEQAAATPEGSAGDGAGTAASESDELEAPALAEPATEPPDPGPVPEYHGIDQADLDRAVSSSVRVHGRVETSDEDGDSAREGSGFAVSTRSPSTGAPRWGDLIATSAHLIADMAEPLIDLADGRKQLPSRLLACDTADDLAVLSVAGTGLEPLPLRTADIPEGEVGVLLAWEHEDGSQPAPAPAPFRISRPVRVLTDSADGLERVERRSWLLAARIESGYSGAALVTDVSGRLEVAGVVWGLSRRDGSDAVYATRADELAELLESIEAQPTREYPEADPAAAPGRRCSSPEPAPARQAVRPR